MINDPMSNDFVRWHKIWIEVLRVSSMYVDQVSVGLLICIQLHYAQVRRYLHSLPRKPSGWILPSTGGGCLIVHTMPSHCTVHTICTYSTGLYDIIHVHTPYKYRLSLVRDSKFNESIRKKNISYGLHTSMYRTFSHGDGGRAGG